MKKEMKEKSPRNLTLNRETLRRLDERLLSELVAAEAASTSVTRWPSIGGDSSDDTSC